MYEILDIVARFLGPALTVMNMILTHRNKDQKKVDKEMVQYKSYTSPFGQNVAGPF
jgi:hypothetical protein